MYNGWFCDLIKCLEVFRDKIPMESFSSITVNAYGDFIIENEEREVYILKHNTKEIWKKCGNWKNGGEWIKIA